jgi:ankyrin repeat protein
MNFLCQYLIIGSFIFSSFNMFCAHYNEEKTEELEQYFSNLVMVGVIPNHTELANNIRMLIDARADPSIPNRQNGSSALHFAAQAGDVDLIRLILRHGIDINIKNNRNTTPIMFAALYKHPDVIHELISLDAHIEAMNREGCTPLMYAANKANQECITHLLGFGASNDIMALNIANHTTHPILRACFSAFPELSELDIVLVRRDKPAFLLLLEYGADPTKSRFNPRVYEWEKQLLADNNSRKLSLYYLNYGYSFNHYLGILLPLSKNGVPMEIIKRIINLMLLE